MPQVKVKNPKNNIKFEPAMVERIERMQKPVVKTEEDYQRTQLCGSIAIIDSYTMKLLAILAHIGALNEDVFDEELEDGSIPFSVEFMEAFKKANNDNSTEAMADIISGMHACSLNYAGMVLEGKMAPIYDASLDDDGLRARAERAVKDRSLEMAEDLAELGALEEQADGSMRLKDKFKLFDTIGG